MSNGLLPIGAFSRATLISVPALRRYHESGLLVPAVIDPATGYRSYDEGQLNDAAVIRRLRLLDMPLDSVARIVAARDPEVTRSVLVEHEQLMAERLEETKRIIAELQAGAEAPSLLSPIHRRHEQAQDLLAIRGWVEEADYPGFLGEAFFELYDTADRIGLQPGPSGATYPAQVADGVNAVVAFLEIDEPVPPRRLGGRVFIAELPAQWVAVGVHRGTYASIDATYRAIGAWVASNAVALDRPVVERYLVSVPDDVDPSDYQTEICWPVESLG